METVTRIKTESVGVSLTVSAVQFLTAAFLKRTRLPNDELKLSEEAER